VSVPVSLFVATRPGRFSLRMVDAEGTPLSRVYFCSREERPLSRDEIVRGYEVEKGRFVVVEDEELEAVAAEKSQEINLERFVDATTIDPIYFDRAYYLAPDRGGSRPYRLLARAMEESGQAGVATFVRHGKEYLVAILAERGLLRVETLRFHDELRTPADVGLPEIGAPKDAKRRAIEKAMSKLHAEELDRKVLTDRQAERLELLVQRKLESGKDVVKAPDAAEPSERESAEIIDLMQVLKRSLQEKESGARATRRGTARRSAPTTRKAPRAASRRGHLQERSKAELYERAKRLDIAGRSQMTKQELIDAIAGAG
jgi:DNA end-binding protein Ku